MAGEAPRPRRSRKSIAFQPNASGINKSSTTLPEAPAKSSRKTRSRSLGPGGLDALNAEEGAKEVFKNSNGNGRRTSLAPTAQVKSILKPTLPLSPLKDIPAHRPRTQLRGAPSNATQPNSIFQPPPPQPTGSQPTATVPLRTEEEQQRRAEILAQRAARRQSLGNRRVSFAPEATLHTWDVVDYYRGDGDSTPGSSAGGSSRASTPASNRRSSSAAPDFPATPTPGNAEPPMTPPGQAGQKSPGTSPSGRSEHPKKYRQAAIAKTPPMNFNNPDDDIMSSSPLSSTAGDDSAFVEEDDGSDSTDSMDEDNGDRTFISAAGETTMGEGDMTFNKIEMGMDIDEDDEVTRKPAFKNPMKWKFEGEPTEFARDAFSPPASKHKSPAAEAGDDDAGEQTMDVTRVVGEGLLSASGVKRRTFSFSPKTPRKNSDDEDGDMAMDMTRPVGGLLPARPGLAQPLEQEDEDSVMDFTRPVGGILNAPSNSHGHASQVVDSGDVTMEMETTRPIGGGILSGMAQRLRQSLGLGLPHFPAKQENEGVDEMDMTTDMDMTCAIGGILPAAPSTQSQPEPPSPAPTTASEVDMNEDMTMEFTSVLGGIINQPPRKGSLGNGRRGGLLMSGEQWVKDQAAKQLLLDSQQEEEMDMDMTMAVGGILPAAAASGASGTVSYPALPKITQDKQDEELEEEDFPMDLTVNLGKIFQNRGVPKASQPSPQQNSTQPQQTATTSKEEVVDNEEPSAPAASVAMELIASPTPVNRRATRRSSGASVLTSPRVTRGAAHRKSLELQQQDPAPKPNPAKVDSSEKPATPVPVKPARKARTPQQKPSPEAQVASPQPSTPQPLPETAKLTPVMPSAEPRTPLKRAATSSTPRRPATRFTSMQLSTQSTPVMTPLRGLGFDRPGLGSPAISSRLSRRKSIGEDTMAFSPVVIPSALIATARQDAQKWERQEKEEKIRREEEEKKMDLKSKIQLLTPRKRGSRMSLAIGSLFPGKRALSNEEEGQRKRRKSADGVGSIVEEENGNLFGSVNPLSKEATPQVTPKKATPKKKPPKKDTPPKAVPQESSEQDPSTLRPQVRAVNFGDDQVMDDEEEAKEEEDGDYESISMQEFLEIIDISFLDDLKATSKRRRTGFAPASRRLNERDEATLEERIKAGAATAPMLNAFQHCCQALERYIAEGRGMIQDMEVMVQEENPLLFREYIHAPAEIRHIMDNQFKHIKTYSRLEAKMVWYGWRMSILEDVKQMLESNLNGLKQDQQTVEQHKQQLLPLLPDIKQNWEKAKHELQNLEEMKRRIDMDDQDALKSARTRLREFFGKVEAARAQTEEKRQLTETVDSKIKELEVKKAALVASIEEAERIKEMNRGWSENEVNTWKTRCEELEKKSGWTVSMVLPDGRLRMLYKRELKLLCDPAGKVAPVVEFVRQNQTDPEMVFLIRGLNAVLSTERNPKAILRKIQDYWTVGDDVKHNIRRLRSRHYTDTHVADDGNLHVKATVLVEEIRSKMKISFVVEKEKLEYQGVSVQVAYGAISQQAVQDMLLNWAGQWREGVNEVVEKCLIDKKRGGIAVGVRG